MAVIAMYRDEAPRWLLTCAGFSRVLSSTPPDRASARKAKLGPCFGEARARGAPAWAWTSRDIMRERCARAHPAAS